MTSSPYQLPQNVSTDVQEKRRLLLAAAQEEYAWVFEPDLPSYVKEMPKAERFTFEKDEKLGLNFGEVVANLGVSELLRPLHRWDSLDDFDRLYPVMKIPDVSKRWRDDREFARQRIAGTNPLVIERCTSLPWNFAVTEDDVAGLLPEGRTLASELDQGRLYLCNFELLHDAHCLDGRVVTAPLALFGLDDSDALVPLAIQITQDGGPVYTPKDSSHDWLLAKLFVQCADAHHNEFVTHLLWTHYQAESFVVATHRQLPELHPIFQLLAPHFRFTLAINRLTRNRVASIGGVFDQIMATGTAGGLEVARKAWRNWNFTGNSFRQQLDKRGLWKDDTMPSYPYRDDGTKIYAQLESYVRDILRMFYSTPYDLFHDYELQAWIAELADPERGRVRGLPAVGGTLDRFEDLVFICTEMIFRSSARHAVVSDGQYDYYGYVPNMPTSLFKAPPTEKGQVDDAWILATLPNQHQSILQIGAIKGAASEFIFRLTRVNPEYWQGSDAPRERRQDFEHAMQALSREIRQINTDRDVPYTYLDPYNVCESLSV